MASYRGRRIKKRQSFVPINVPVPIPALAFYRENPETVAVFIDGKRVGQTALITDVEETARVEFDAMRPWVLARPLGSCSRIAGCMSQKQMNWGS